MELSRTSQPKTSGLEQIYVAQRVIDKMCRGALLYQGSETGEALVGLAIANGNGRRLPKIYLMDTIPPIEETVREWAMFEQGDDWQGSMFNWWYENWEMYRELRRASYGNALAAKWDAPLQHLGDWHKQPGMIRPSRGDWGTARQFIREFDLDFLITPIVTLANEVEDIPAGNTVVVILETELTSVRIDFWWIARRGNDFRPIEPVIVPDEDLPRLPPIAWWLENRDRLDMEVDMLEADGLQVLDIVSWNTRGHPPLDTCLTVYRPGTRNVLIAITPVNYPRRAPSWRVAPIMRPRDNEDFFAALYQTSAEVPASILPDWSPGMTLLDGIKAIEQQKERGQ